MRVAIGLDVGTTSVKAVALGEDGGVLGEGSSSPLGLRVPKPEWAVQSTYELYDAVVEALSSVVESLPAGVEPASLCAATQSGSVIVVSPDGVVEGDLVTWMDTRSAEIVSGWIADGTSDLVRQISGWSVHPGQGLPQLAWRPRLESVGRVGSADDLVVHWLTGDWVTNPSNAAGMALIETETGRWSGRLCALAGVRVDQLSELRSSGDLVGPLLPSLAEATGLSAGLSVVAGGHDQACAALALGVAEPDSALLAGGTAWVLTTVIEPDAAPEVPSEMNLSFHVVPGAMTASEYLGGLGTSMEWLLGEQGGDGDDRFASLDAALGQATTTSSSPYFVPYSPSSSGAVGRPGAGRFVNQSDSDTDADRARAVMEYAAFVVKKSLMVLPEDHRPTSLTVVGGVTRSPGWTQLIADVCGLPVVEASNRSLPALGAAVIGGVASGVFTDYRAATDRLAISSVELHPDPEMTSMYRDRYETYLSLEA